LSVRLHLMTSRRHRAVKGILGGAATYFSLAASYFTQVRMVAVVGDDFGAEHEDILKNRGVDTRGIERASGKTFRWGRDLC